MHNFIYMKNLEQPKSQRHKRMLFAGAAGAGGHVELLCARRVSVLPVNGALDSGDGTRHQERVQYH